MTRSTQLYVRWRASSRSSGPGPESSPFDYLTPVPTASKVGDADDSAGGSGEGADGERTAPTQGFYTEVKPTDLQSLSGETERLDIRVYDLYRELASSRARSDELERQVAAHEMDRRLIVANAAVDGIGLFILKKIQEREDGIGLDELSEHLAPKGWLALARLLKADLLDENDRIVYATASGEELTAELLGAPGSSPTSGGDAR